MSKCYLNIAALSLLLGSNFSLASEAGSSNKSDIWDKLTIVDSLSGNGDPATLWRYQPSKGESSSKVDFGLRYTLWGSDLATFGPTLEYHRNTDNLESVKTYSMGLGGYYQHGEVVNIDSNGDVIGKADKLLLMDRWGAMYKNDDIAETKSIQLSYVQRPIYIPLGIGTSQRTGSGRYGLDLDYGVEYESILEENDGLELKGESLRLRVGAKLVFYPAYAIPEIRKRLALSFGSEYWNEITSTGQFDEDNKQTYSENALGLVYYFDENRRIGIGLDYVKGENLGISSVEQDHILLGLKIRNYAGF